MAYLFQQTERCAVFVRIWAFCVIGFTAARAVIASLLETTDIGVDFGGFAWAFLVGFVHDALVAAIIALISLAILGRLRRWKISRLTAHALVVGLLSVMIFCFIAEVFFWEEFSSRFNGIAVYYLMFPREVIGNLQESFNVASYLPFILLGAIALWWPNKSSLQRFLVAERSKDKFLKRAGRSLVAIGAPIGLLWIMPLHTDSNRELDYLAKNDLVTAVSALMTNDADYEGIYKTIPQDDAMPILRSIVAQDNTTFLEPDGILRRVDNGPVAPKPNIVLVTEETFGSVFVDSLDNKLDVSISPDLDKLALDGLMFTNTYASGDRTVRGLEATETSFAPIPGISTTRRPGSVGMHSLPHLLESFGYKTGILYGGLTPFDNMGAFWEGIGFDNVWGETDVRHESFKTIWGVSDEDLFTEALLRMDEQTADGSPALLTLMTVSNHRPYKFPQTHIKWDDRMGRIQNTARYAQWAFVDFVERSREKSWFDDTIFIFVGDHGKKVNGSARIPVHSFRVPLLFYGPKFIAPGRNDTLGGQLDMIPTLLGLLGFSYDSPFFGLDLTRVPDGGGRISIAHNFSIAYGRRGHLVILEPNGETLGYTFEPGSPEMNPESPHPDILMEAVSQTQEAHRMFYAGKYHWN